MARWIEKIQKNLTPDLLKKEYRDENKSNPLLLVFFIFTPIY